MNRAEMAQAVIACEVLAAELRAALTAEARAEYDEHRAVPTWRMPGVTVSAATSRPSVAVVDEAAFLDWVAARHPTEVEKVVITRVRPAWQQQFLKQMASRGDVCDTEGEVVPGLTWRPGGDFESIKLLAPALKDAARSHAAEIIAGRRPLELPTADEISGERS